MIYRCKFCLEPVEVSRVAPITDYVLYAHCDQDKFDCDVSTEFQEDLEWSDIHCGLLSEAEVYEAKE